MSLVVAVVAAVNSVDSLMFIVPNFYKVQSEKQVMHFLVENSDVEHNGVKRQ